MNGRHLGAMFSDPGLVAQIEAMSDYRLVNYSGSALLIKTSGLVKWERWLFAPWRKFMDSGLKEVEISGLHGSIFEKSGIEYLASAMRNQLKVVIGYQRDIGRK